MLEIPDDRTEPRLSRMGSAIAVFGALSMLVVSAPVTQPLRAPADIEALVTTAVWWAAAALSAWLGLSVLVWLVVLDSGAPRIHRWLQVITVPGSRKLAEGMLAASMVVVPSCSPGAAEVAAPRLEVLQPAESPIVVTAPATVSSSVLPDIRFSIPTTLIDTSTLATRPRRGVEPGVGTPLPNEPDVPRSETSIADPASQSEEPGPGAGDSTTYEIQPGDHFWSIAAGQVAAGLDRQPTDVEVSQYWIALVEANRTTIASGDPDLIFPNERIVLP